MPLCLNVIYVYEKKRHCLTVYFQRLFSKSHLHVLHQQNTTVPIQNHIIHIRQSIRLVYWQQSNNLRNQLFLLLLFSYNKIKELLSKSYALMIWKPNGLVFCWSRWSGSIVLSLFHFQMRTLITWYFVLDKGSICSDVISVSSKRNYKSFL